MEIIMYFSRPTENQKDTIPESIAAQWIPGRFYIIFWKRAALIFYRDIDCQSIIGVYDFHGFHLNTMVHIWLLLYMVDNRRLCYLYLAVLSRLYCFPAAFAVKMRSKFKGRHWSSQDPFHTEHLSFQFVELLYKSQCAMSSNCWYMD